MRLLEFISKKTKLDNLLIVDPGLANLCIAVHLQKKAYLLHFNSLIEIEKSSVYDELGKYNEKPFTLVVENQTMSNRNILLQGYICGLLTARLNVEKILCFSPRLKNKIATSAKFTYCKVTSNIIYERIVSSNFKEYIKKWSIYEGVECAIKQVEFLKVKKKDDLIDCFLVSWFIKSD